MPSDDRREYLADRLNDAWAVVRCVSHLEGNLALRRHDRDGTIDGLPDDLLDAAKYIRPNPERLRDRQHVPPGKALAKYRARLDRLLALGIEPERWAVGSKHLPPFGERVKFATELQYVLRDYQKLIDGLLPEEPDQEG